MKRIIFAAAAAGLIAPFGLGSPAPADPGDHAKKQWEKRADFAKKQWEKRADCDKKLAKAKSRRDFSKKLDECSRELAKLGHEQRKEAAKAWREAEKTWRERDGDGGYYPHHPWHDDDD